MTKLSDFPRKERPSHPEGDYSSLPYEPPARPGQSRYCVKGLGYRSVLDDCERTVPGGKAAFLAAIEPRELREFFEQDFLAGSWFDVFPLPLGRHIAARLARVPFAKQTRDAMRFTAERDAQTVYRSLLDKGSPSAILEALDVVARQYLNFSPLVRAELPTPTTRVVFRDGLPKVLVSWVEAFTRGYTASVFELVAKIHDVRTTITTSPEPSADGIELVTMRIETSWTQP